MYIKQRNSNTRKTYSILERTVSLGHLNYPLCLPLSAQPSALCYGNITTKSVAKEMGLNLPSTLCLRV